MRVKIYAALLFITLFFLKLRSRMKYPLNFAIKETLSCSFKLMLLPTEQNMRLSVIHGNKAEMRDCIRPIAKAGRTTDNFMSPDQMCNVFVYLLLLLLLLFFFFFFSGIS